MSYEKAKRITYNKKDNTIHITSVSNNVQPQLYERFQYDGTLEDLFDLLIGGSLNINSSNKQIIHEAYLTALIYLVQNKVHPFDVYHSQSKENRTLEDDKILNHYNKSRLMFVDIVKNGKQNKQRYYLEIDGNYFIKWTKYGYRYSYGNRVETSWIDVLMAQAYYGNDRVAYREVI